MLKSMTGFASSRKDIPALGRISLEIRSTNHKFLEVVLHLPEGFLALEEKVKKEIEAKIKRGRIVCALNIVGGHPGNVFINRRLAKSYFSSIQKIKGQLRLEDNLTLDTLVRLPGVVSLVENDTAKVKIWPALKILLRQVVAVLEIRRQKEGRAISRYLNYRAKIIESILKRVKAKFKQVMQRRLQEITRDEAAAANLLKESDITEELERLAFHIRNFSAQLSKQGPVGKELDFIAQEMQREANTLGAKSGDIFISGQVIQLKSQIEKIREQLQNIE